ncbi:MAG: hypothetical protein JWO02_3980, partial [Solirubrobacterales bacterium]|nr:hypothetical protein [Solirubrobacterales bacterium]
TECAAAGVVAALRANDEWLFGLTDADLNRLGARGDGMPPDAAVSTVAHAARLEKVAEALAELGVRLVVAVAPTKLAVHCDLAPEVAPADEDRPGHRLESAARDSDHLHVLDLTRPLRDARVHGPLFHPRDESWNARGAFFAHRALLKAAGVRGLQPLGIDRCELAASRRAVPCALETVPCFAHRDGRLVAGPPAPAATDGPPALEPDAATLRARRMPAGSHLEIDGLPAPRVYERREAPGVPRILLLGDACILPLIPWLGEVASRLVVLRTAEAPLEQIELELPDLVLFVLDEHALTLPPRSGEHVVEGGADEPLDAGVDALPSGPVV